jgi:argininosuccinate lyase
MEAAALQGFSTATDLADYLVGKGIAFRDAHEVVGRAVRYGIDNDKDLSAMSLQELQGFSDMIDEDVFTVLSLAGSMAARDHVGGTAPAQVRKAVSAARLRLQAD